MSEVVLAKARELGYALTQSPEYQEVKQRQKNLFRDDVALEMLKKFHAMQDAAQKKQSRGEELSKDEMKDLEKLELTMAGHPSISIFHESQRKYQELINKVLETVIQVQRDEQHQDLVQEQSPHQESGQ